MWGGLNMILDKPAKKKFIDAKKFSENARKVLESLKQERDFLLEKKIKNGNNISFGSPIYS